jgi:hypothetical protein
VSPGAGIATNDLTRLAAFAKKFLGALLANFYIAAFPFTPSASSLSRNVNGSATI